MVSMNLKSLYVKDKSLQIFSFRVVDVNGMVGRLVQLVQDAHRAASLSSSREYSIAEVVFCYHLRAGEGEQDSAWSNLLECFCIEAGIAFQCVVQSSAMLGKGRWVEDDEVV